MAQWQITFTDLKFGELIGKGNFGEVYKGEYLGTDVAIKKLLFVDEEFMQTYIEREMETLTQIRHPNIVQLMGVCVESDLYIVTEFIKGGALRKRLKDSDFPMDWALKVNLMKDVALAMTYLHSKDIIHRDLKSHNLLLDESNKVKVCDFGLARKDETGAKEGKTIVGTNEWMAPEIAMGENYDRSVDVFSFAMVMWEIITRDKPPQRKLIKGYAWVPEDVTEQLPKDTPPKLWALLNKCADSEPKVRPSFQDIVSELKVILDELQAAPAKKSGSKKKKSKKKSKKADGEKKKKKKKKSTKTDGEKKKKKKKKTSGEKQ